MSRRKTIEEVMKQYNEKYNSDFSKQGKLKYIILDQEYKNNHTKITVVCPKHGNFMINSANLLLGKGCPKCAVESTVAKQKRSFADIRTQYEKTWKKKNRLHYILPDQEYKNNHTKIKVICPKHGEFKILTGNLFKGIGCPKCGVEKRSNTQRDTLDDVRNKYEDSWNKNGRLHYIIPNQKYVNSQTKIRVICPKHNDFYISSSNLLYGKSCSKCVHEYQRTPEEAKKLIAELGEEHYKLVGSYANTQKKTVFYHEDCGNKFDMSLSNFMQGHRCPYCASSTGEKMMYNILQDNEIKFETQWKYKAEKHTHYFDFFLPEYKVLIEMQGEQHYYTKEHKSKPMYDPMRKVWDKEKAAIANKLGYKLLAIKYTDFEPKKLVAILNNNNIVCSYNDSVDYLKSTKHIKEVATYYLTHSIKETHERYNFSLDTIIRYFKSYYKVGKKDYLKSHPNLLE